MEVAHLLICLFLLQIDEIIDWYKSGGTTTRKIIIFVFLEESISFSIAGKSGSHCIVLTVLDSRRFWHYHSIVRYIPTKLTGSVS